MNKTKILLWDEKSILLEENDRLDFSAQHSNVETLPHDVMEGDTAVESLRIVILCSGPRQSPATVSEEFKKVW
jgi:hypothetical protein